MNIVLGEMKNDNLASENFMTSLKEFTKSPKSDLGKALGSKGGDNAQARKGNRFLKRLDKGKATFEEKKAIVNEFAEEIFEKMTCGDQHSTGDYSPNVQVGDNQGDITTASTTSGNSYYF